MGPVLPGGGAEQQLGVKSNRIEFLRSTTSSGLVSFRYNGLVNNSFSKPVKRGVFAGVGILTCLLIATLGLEEPIRIGSRLELLDRHLVDRLSGGAELRLHRPVPREVSLVRDEPWEGNASGYTTVFQDGSRYRMYYRGKQTTYTQGTITVPHREVICYAESQNGIQWLKPRLDLIKFDGSRANNIIWDDVGSHNFAPFKDDNPAAERERRYKAVGGKKRQGGLYAFQSPDGIHWSRMSEKPIITKGALDSQNLAFWDRIRGEYRSYIRDFRAAQQFFCNFRVGCGTGSSSLGSRVQKAVAREPLAVNLSKATSRSIKMRGRSSLHYSQRAIQRPHLLLQEKRPCQKPSEPRSRAAPYREPSLI